MSHLQLYKTIAIPRLREDSFTLKNNGEIEEELKKIANGYFTIRGDDITIFNSDLGFMEDWIVYNLWETVR